MPTWVSARPLTVLAHAAHARRSIVAGRSFASFLQPSRPQPLMTWMPSCASSGWSAVVTSGMRCSGGGGARHAAYAQLADTLAAGLTSPQSTAIAAPTCSPEPAAMPLQATCPHPNPHPPHTRPGEAPHPKIYIATAPHSRHLYFISLVSRNLQRVHRAERASAHHHPARPHARDHP